MKVMKLERSLPSYRCTDRAANRLSHILDSLTICRYLILLIASSCTFVRGDGDGESKEPRIKTR